ncbi:MAG: hypothetical protein J6A69_12800 [Clostridia bacterium]|nr:hypothetical protein [Clostridia bacterium]
MKSKYLKWIIPVIIIALVAVAVTVFALNQRDVSGAVLSLEYNGELTNSAGNDYHPVTYGDLAFTNNGMIDKALEFRNGRIDITGSEGLKLGKAFTFATWIKVTDTLSVDPILFCREASNGDKVTGPLNIHFSDGYTFLRTDITFVDKKGNYSSYSFASDKLWSAETVTSMWHHIAVVFDGDVLSYYVDSHLSGSERLPEGLKGYDTIANNSKIFSIGAGQFDDMYAILDETRFYMSAVSPEEIASLYNAAKKEYKNTLVLKPGSDEAIYNGKKEKLPVAITRDKETERLMVPLRYVTDRMGGTINWDGSDGYGRADIILGENQISIWLMDTNALSNHKYCKLDAYPQEINDTMCVPIRFVAEELGASVNWNEEKEEVTILF